MPVYDVLGPGRKHYAMSDTWGHLYPKPGKYPCVIFVSDGPVGGQTILDYRLDLCGSPQVQALTSSALYVFDWPQDKASVYRIDCELWFFKNCADMYLGEPIGKIIKAKIKKVFSE